jgi:hypothetical protein
MPTWIMRGMASSIIFVQIHQESFLKFDWARKHELIHWDMGGKGRLAMPEFHYIQPVTYLAHHKFA